MSDTVTYTWVINQYDPRSDRGKSVLNHSGRMYHILNQNRGKTDPIIAAFKFVGYPIPADYVEATEEQAEKLERMDKPWTNHNDRRTKRDTGDSKPEKVDFNAMFPAKKEETK